jgi:hypothetical protein
MTAVDVVDGARSRHSPLCFNALRVTFMVIPSVEFGASECSAVE